MAFYLRLAYNIKISLVLPQWDGQICRINIIYSITVVYESALGLGGG